MIGRVEDQRGFSGHDGAAIRRLVEPRVLRVVEEPCDGPADRRCDDERCPPAQPVFPGPGPIPFDRFLEQRNREDRVEFSLGKSEVCPPAGMKAGVRRLEEMDADEPRPAPRRRGESEGRAPRLGDVSPVAAEAVQRRLETAYRPTATLKPGARLDLVG